MSNKKAKALRRALRSMKQDEEEEYTAVYHPSPAWTAEGPVIRYKVQRMGKGAKSAAKFARKHGINPNQLEDMI